MNWSYFIGENARKYPDKDAIIFHDRHFAYREFNSRINAMAKGLLDLGIKKGDIVAFLLLNCPEFIELSIAVNRIGAIWLPINFRLAGEEIAYILNNGEVKLIISETWDYELKTDSFSEIESMNIAMAPSFIINLFSKSECDCEDNSNCLERARYTLLFYSQKQLESIQENIDEKLRKDEKSLVCGVPEIIFEKDELIAYSYCNAYTDCNDFHQGLEELLANNYQ